MTGLPGVSGRNPQAEISQAKTIPSSPIPNLIPGRALTQVREKCSTESLPGSRPGTRPLRWPTDRQPPMGLWKFFLYFLRQFRTAFILQGDLVAFGAVADAMMPIFVGLIVGMLADTPPGNLFSAHWQTLLIMALFLLLRPLTFLVDQLVRNQAIVPNLVDLVRWQSHWHVVRQSWTFFQNDFAGRIANKMMQAARPWRSASTSPSMRCGTRWCSWSLQSWCSRSSIRCCWCRSPCG